MIFKAPDSILPMSQVSLYDGSLLTVDAAGNISTTTGEPRNISGLMALGFSPIAEGSGRLEWTAGNFYGPPGETLAAVLTVISTLYMHPIRVPNRVTVTSISCLVTTGQTGGKARMGIYSDQNGRPGQLILDAGEVTGLTGGGAGTKGSLTQALNPGWYWLAGEFGATSTMPSVAGVAVSMTSDINEFLGSTTVALALAVASTNATTGLSGTLTYGALPTIPPTMAAITAATCPAFCLGV